MLFQILKSAIFKAQEFDGATGGPINLALINEKGTERKVIFTSKSISGINRLVQKIRPDGSDFPVDKAIISYPNFPKHIQQPPPVKGKTSV